MFDPSLDTKEEETKQEAGFCLICGGRLIEKKLKAFCTKCGQLCQTCCDTEVPSFDFTQDDTN